MIATAALFALSLLVPAAAGQKGSMALITPPRACAPLQIAGAMFSDTTLAVLLVNVSGRPVEEATMGVVLGDGASSSPMVTRGLQIQTLTPQAEEEWQQMAEPLYPTIHGTPVPAGLFDDVTRLVSEHRAQKKPEPATQPEPVTKPEPATQLELTGLPVSTLATVYVLDDSGRETKGMLVGLDAVSIEIRAEDGTVRRYEIANVRRISKRGDSLKNGTIAGAVFGVVINALRMGLVDDSAGGKILGFLASTAFYAAVGAGIDALIPGRTTIFVAWPVAKTGAPRPSAQRGYPGRIDVAFAVTW